MGVTDDQFNTAQATILKLGKERAPESEDSQAQLPPERAPPQIKLFDEV